MGARRTGTTLAAVILAGGKGERLGGVVKANLTVGGIRLIDRVAGALGDVNGLILVAHGGLDQTLMDLPDGAIPIPDLPGWGGGPLAGIAAAAAWCLAAGHPPQRLLSVAVDTPFFPPDFAVLAVQKLKSPVAAVVARYAGQNYPTNALWSVEALRPLITDPALAAGGIKGFLGTLAVATLDWPIGPEGDPFANVNTPADLAVLQARAGRHERPENGVGKAGQTR